MEVIEIPFGYIKAGKIYQSAWGDHPDREIGEVRDEDNDKSTKFFLERFADLEAKVKEVIDKIDNTENKGSFLMKLVHLRENLSQHDGLGDYLILQETLSKYEALVRDIILKNRSRNTEIKTALIEETKQVIEIVNWKEASEKINDVKNRWIKTGSAEEEKNETLEETFWGIIQSFYDRKKQFYEDKQKLTDHRKRQYEELVDEAKKLKELHGQERFNKVKDLKEQWKEIGGVPAEIYQPLFQEFNQQLKGKKFVPQTNYSEILKELEQIKNRDNPFEKDRIDKIKKSLFADKRRNPDKQKCLELIQLLTEREFVKSLTQKRFPDFDKLEADKKRSIRIGIIKDLINRDKDDLKIYEENSANFSSVDGNMNKMVENKIKGQKRKIEIKSMLLEWIESGFF